MFAKIADFGLAKVIDSETMLNVRFFCRPSRRHYAYTLIDSMRYTDVCGA